LQASKDEQGKAVKNKPGTRFFAIFIARWINKSYIGKPWFRSPDRICQMAADGRSFEPCGRTGLRVDYAVHSFLAGQLAAALPPNFGNHQHAGQREPAV
jgi:hypothetical protein